MKREYIVFLLGYSSWFFCERRLWKDLFSDSNFFFHFLLSVNTWSLFLSNDFLAWYRGSTDFASVHPLLFWHTIEARVAAAIPRKFPRDISIYILSFFILFPRKERQREKDWQLFFPSLCYSTASNRHNFTKPRMIYYNRMARFLHYTTSMNHFYFLLCNKKYPVWVWRRFKNRRRQIQIFDPNNK